MAIGKAGRVLGLCTALAVSALVVGTAKAQEINAHGVLLGAGRQRYHFDNNGFPRIW